MRTVLNRMKNLVSIFPILIFWVMADCIYNIQWRKVCHRSGKKFFKSVQIYRKDAHCSDNNFLISEFVFVRILVFDIRSILYMLDFVICACDLMYAKSPTWGDYLQITIIVHYRCDDWFLWWDEQVFNVFFSRKSKALL